MMMLRRLFADTRGTMAVETALVAPVLIVLGIGGFQVSDMVAHQHNLESAAALGEQIALASKPDSQAKLDTMKAVIHASTGVPLANITTTFKYRCGTSATLQTTNSCGSDPPWTFVSIAITETYTPAWSRVGIGSSMGLEVDRTVQIA
jgi:Flp pilus assembly protein TadG